MTVSLSLRLASLREAILYAADSVLEEDFRMSSSKRMDRLAMSEPTHLAPLSLFRQHDHHPGLRP